MSEKERGFLRERQMGNLIDDLFEWLERHFESCQDSHNGKKVIRDLEIEFWKLSDSNNAIAQELETLRKYKVS